MTFIFSAPSTEEGSRDFFLSFMHLEKARRRGFRGLYYFLPIRIG
jgi:hypothetical protein